MNRRDFLKMLGVGIAAPKLIFDMGKNSRLYSLLEAHPRLIMPAVDPAFPENVVYFVNGSSIEFMENHMLDSWAYVMPSLPSRKLYEQIEIDKPVSYKLFSILKV